MSIWCEVRADGCWGHATDRHHRKMRSQGGTNDGFNILAACHHCHMEVHRSPELAYQHGWLVKSWQDPALVPVKQWTPIEEVA